jgi:hypothetical protein
MLQFVLEHVGKVVDSLYVKVCSLYFFLVVIFDILSDMTGTNLNGYNCVIHLPFSWVEYGFILCDQLVIRHTTTMDGIKKATVDGSLASDRDSQTYSDLSCP